MKDVTVKKKKRLKNELNGDHWYNHFNLVIGFLFKIILKK